MVRNIISHATQHTERAPERVLINGASWAASAPIATSGNLIGARDLGGATRERSVAEILAREKPPLVDDDGRPKRVPVLRDGRWVMELPTAAVRHDDAAVTSLASPGAAAPPSPRPTRTGSR